VCVWGVRVRLSMYLYDDIHHTYKCTCMMIYIIDLSRPYERYDDIHHKNDETVLQQICLAIRERQDLFGLFW
jgi:hypothetical protein